MSPIDHRRTGAASGGPTSAGIVIDASAMVQALVGGATEATLLDLLASEFAAPTCSMWR